MGAGREQSEASCEYVTRLHRKCEICEEPFRVIPAEVRRGKGRFCSRACANRWQSAVKTQALREHRCGQCGACFFTPRRSKQRFCSRACGFLSRRGKPRAPQDRPIRFGADEHGAYAEVTVGKFQVPVDIGDAESLRTGPWCISVDASGNPYVVMTIKPKRSLHRLLLGLERGDKSLVDHADGNTLNNRRYNLREATPQLNAFNKHKKRPGASSQYRGVTYDRRNRLRPWCAQFGGRPIGYFATELEAARAYDETAAQRFPGWVPLNFRDQAVA